MEEAREYISKINECIKNNNYENIDVFKMELEDSLKVLYLSKKIDKDTFTSLWNKYIGTELNSTY